MNNKIFKLALTSLLLLAVNLSAQSSNIVEDITKNAHLANINTLLIFTSQDSLNSGVYHFTKIGVDMSIYHLPFSYTLNPNNETLEYFVVGNVGYSRVNLSKDIEIPPNSRLTYDNHIATYTAGLGIGVRYKFTKELSTSTGVEFIYSRSGARVDKPDDNIGDAIEGFFNKNYNDNISYKFFIDAMYRKKMKLFNPFLKLSYKTYQTKSSFTFDELSKFGTDSSVSTLSVGAESNKLLSVNNSYLTVEAYLNANHLDGTVVSTVKFDNYASIGTVGYIYSKYISWIQRYFLELNVIRADGLEGYNIGLGFTIDY